MYETYARPRFGEPRQPKNRVNPGSRLAGMIDFVTVSHVRAIAFLALCGLLLFLPGFFNIPPIDRDEARFAQATKQMVESGDFVDIRFQDDVRYKKPVGVYWLQAAVVETASALGLPRAPVRVWLYRVPSLIGAIGAVLLTYWNALAFVTRRGAILAALILCSSVLLGAEARLAKTDAMLLLSVVAAMGAMARVYLSWQRGEDPAHPPWSWPAIFWTALAGGILLKGPLILMFVGLTIVTLAILDRSAAWLWRLRPVWGLMWTLVLVDVLAGSGARRDGRARGVAGEAGARRAIPAGVAGSVLDRVRTGADQTAALRAAALSGDRHPDGWRVGAPRVVAIMVDARRRLVVCHSCRGFCHCRYRRDHADASAGVSGVAVRGGSPHLRAVRVVALRRQSRRTLAAERRGVGDVFGLGDLWRRGAGADAAISQRRGRARAAQRRLRRTESRRRRLSRAKSCFHDRHLDGADGRLGRRGFPGPGQLQVRAGGSALGTRFRPARRSHRAAL